MKKEDKRIMKDILQGTDLERNLPVYASSYINSAYEYSLIHLVLNYYTMKEVKDDLGGAEDTYLSMVMDNIHTMLFKTVLSDELNEDYTKIVEEINVIRNEMTKKMRVLTAYTDALQIYEYVLNRAEYGITGETFPVEESALAAKTFQYLFSDNDKMVVNSKIQLVTGQLPIRMTKSRFFDYLTDTLNIYKGSDRSALDDFMEMLKSSALLELPEGYSTDYPGIRSVIKQFEAADFKALDLAAFKELQEQFVAITNHLTELVSNYLLAMEIVNDFYAVLLAMLYEKNESENIDTCKSMLKGIHDAFLSESEIPESVDDGFIQIEGRQEELGEDILQYESILSDVITEHADTISWIMSDKIFNSLSLIAKLLSNSLFVDLDDKEEENEVADAAYITEKRDELVGSLTEFFASHSKEVNRAVMAAMFSNMPVLFNSQQEIKDYIEYSLNHCSNQSELMACAKILEDLMEEE